MIGRISEFDAWLNRLHACTDKFEQNNGYWTIFEQIAHTHSEVSEVYQAIKDKEGRERIIEEICDSVLASFTMAHVLEISDGELAATMERTLQKVERRAGLRA